MPHRNDSTSRLVGTVVIVVTMVGAAAGQSSPRVSSSAASVSAQLARAEQLYDEQNYRQAAAILQPLIDANPVDSGAGGEIRAATRLLALVYHRSADHHGAIRFVDRYRRLTRSADAEMALILAENNLALGRYEDAARQLSIFHATSPGTAAGDVRQMRLTIEADRVATAIHRATMKTNAAAADVQHEALRPTVAIKIIPANYLDEQRFDAIMLFVNRCLDANPPGEAIALLKGEIRSPAYTNDEQAELHLRLANCYAQQAALLEEAGDVAGREAASAAEHQILDRLAALLRARRIDLSKRGDEAPDHGSRAERVEDWARLLGREAAVRERNAELAANAHPDHDAQLWRAVKLYRHLEQQANKLDDLRRELSAQQAGEADQIALGARAALYRDMALCGSQRVCEALRKSLNDRHRQAAHTVADRRRIDDQSNVEYHLQWVRNELRRVSKRLADERQQRLLPTDPTLYDAKRALASVYGMLGEHVRAEPIYRELTAYWEASSRPDPERHARALLGLSETLRALDKMLEAQDVAQRAKQSAEKITGDDKSRRGLDILLARIDNALAVTSIALGDYEKALMSITEAHARLEGTPLDENGESVAELRRETQQTLLVLSRTKVFRGLLDKAEARYDDAADGVRAGREMRERLEDDADMLAYHLAEASVELARARPASHRQASSAGSPPSDALQNARTALQRAAERANGDLNYEYLQGVMYRLLGERDKAEPLLTDLASRSEKQGDSKTSAKCYTELARLAVAEIATIPKDRDELPSKRERKKLLQRASDHADHAADLFSPKIYPSLHFQAAFLAAQLHVLLAGVELHIDRLELQAAPDGAMPIADASAASSAESRAAHHRALAIDLLKEAVALAEQPASTTTRRRLDRAKFFARYAPAYDLLVDLYVAQAVGAADSDRAEQPSEKFNRLRDAIMVADLARNRTFREQIAGWRASADDEYDPRPLHWEQLEQLAGPDAALLVYHLDGPQLLGQAAHQVRSTVARIGGGHLFVILNQGREIRYHRLLHRESETSGPSDLTREMAADLVRRQIEWIERPNENRDWGRAEQQALTRAVLPLELLRCLIPGAGKASTESPVRRLVIVPDGALHQLPFESLLVPTQVVAVERQIRYVLDELPPIRYGPSLSVLAAIEQRGRRTDDEEIKVLTVGHPAYPTAEQQRKMPTWKNSLPRLRSDVGAFAPLAHSAAECRAVFESFDDLPVANRTQLLQAAATEAEVTRHIKDNHFVHIAAHGYVEYADDNLLGALVFAPGLDHQKMDQDGFLQLREIYGLKLAGCELAVLSACQTSVGAERPLEAGTSMARAFLEQGAMRVVCSQWSADDAATAEFMTAFYDTIRASRQANKKVDYADALNEARKKVRQTHPEPRYWSPFVLVGAS